MSKHKELLSSHEESDGRILESYRIIPINIKCNWDGESAVSVASHLSDEGKEVFYALFGFMLTNYTLNELNARNGEIGVGISDISTEIVDEIDAISLRFEEHGLDGDMGTYTPFMSKYGWHENDGKYYRWFIWRGQLNENGEFILESEQERKRIEEAIKNDAECL